MAHEHRHHDKTTYYLEQFSTIIVCAALGVVMILLWSYNVLGIFLDPKFHDPVLWGGIALLVLVAVRMIALWLEAKSPEAQGNGCGHDHEDCHDHEHAHGHEHAHEHEHVHVHEHGNEHEHIHGVPAQGVETAVVNGDADDAADCGHDHGWAPWRYAVLILPVVLFLMHMPWPDPPDQPEQQNVVPLHLTEAADAANSEQTRAYWRGRMQNESVRLKGKLENPYPGDRHFAFVRLRMTCCFADAYGEPVNLRVDSPKPLNLAKLKGSWVKVIGKLDFDKRSDGQYISVVKAEIVTGIPTPANQFEN
jgi:hypothetical protein